MDKNKRFTTGKIVQRENITHDLWKIWLKTEEKLNFELYDQNERSNILENDQISELRIVFIGESEDKVVLNHKGLTINNKEIEDLLKHDWLEEDDIRTINDCATMLNKDIEPKHWQAFKTFCKAQDDFRDVRLEDYHPQLAKEML